MPRFSPEDVERFIEALRADDALRSRVEQAILSDRLVRLPDTVDVGLRRMEDALGALAESVKTLAEAVDSRLSTLENAVAETNRNMNWLVQDGFPRMLGIVSKIGDDVEQVKGDVEQVKGDVEQVKGDVEQVKGDVMAVKVDVALLNDRMRIVERHLGLAS